MIIAGEKLLEICLKVFPREENFHLSKVSKTRGNIVERGREDDKW